MVAFHDEIHDEFELDSEIFQEFEHDDDLEGSFDDELVAESGDEMPFDEGEEMELAAELLEAAEDDEELEQFLGRLVRRAARGIRRFSRSRLGRRLVGRLKGFARRSLGDVGQHLGRRLLGRAGASAGRRLATAAGRRFFGLELEGLSPEDQEFEVARRFVRFAGAATRRAVRGRGAPERVVGRSLAAAARRFAPGMLRGGSSRRPSGRGRGAGRWVRRGRTIVLLGVS